MMATTTRRCSPRLLALRDDYVPRAGDTLGRYVLNTFVNMTIYGSVWLANDATTGEQVCIKASLLKLSDNHTTSSGTAVLESARSEIEVLVNLTPSHNVVRYIEHWEANGHLFLVLGFAGPDLFDFLTFVGDGDTNKRIPEDVALNVFQQMLNGVRHCHSQGVALMDVSLENFCIDEKNAVVRLIDFGVAQQNCTSSSTIAGRASCFDPPMGKLRYICPEAHAGIRFNAFSGDLFSLGVCLYMMVTGKPPFAVASNSDGWFRLFASGKWKSEKMRIHHPTSSKAYGHLSNEIVELIDGLLKWEEHRWGWAQVGASRPL